MNREQRIRIAEETLESIEQGFYINQYGVRLKRRVLRERPDSIHVSLNAMIIIILTVK
mgnify:CR=1 FL=1